MCPSGAFFLCAWSVRRGGVAGDTAVDVADAEAKRDVMTEKACCSSSCAMQGSLADQAHKWLRHCYGVGAHLAATHFPGAPKRRSGPCYL